MLTDGEWIPFPVASTKLEKGMMTLKMKEKLQAHKQIEQEQKRKIEEWKRKEGKAA